MAQQQPKEPDFLDDKRWPRDVRAALNWLLMREKRPREVKFAGAGQAGEWQQGDNREVLILPNPRGTARRKPFALYVASSVAPLKIGIKFGLVTCYQTESGLEPWPEDFTSPDYTYEFTVSAAGICWLKVTNDISGDTNKVSDIQLGHGSTFPSFDAEIGYRALGNWILDGDGRIRIISGEGETAVGHQFYNYCGETHFFAP